MADVHNGAAPPITREMYKSTAAVLPSPAADFTRISFPAGCGVQSQPPHPGGSSQDQGGGRVYTGAGRGLAERQHRPPSAAAPGVGMVDATAAPWFAP